MDCSECQAIARELSEAYAEAWANADHQTREASLAVQKLLGGTEEDAERAEELVANAKPLDYRQRIQRALLKKYTHQARTGHKIPPTA